MNGINNSMIIRKEIKSPIPSSLKLSVGIYFDQIEFWWI